MVRMKRFFAVFLATLVILGNLPVYAVSSVGAAAKSEYLKTEKRFFTKLEENFEKSELGKLLNFTEGIAGAYNSAIDLEIKLPDIKTRKYVIQENGTYQDRYEDGAIEAYVEGEKVATFNVVANDNLVSLQVPELYEKYLTVNTSDLLSLAQKFDENITEEDIPLKGMIYNSDIIKELKLSKEEEKLVKNASKKYAKLLDEELLKNIYFKKGNRETLNIDGTSYKCKTVSYQISVKQLVDGLEKIWTEFKNDTELVKLIWGKVEAIYNLNAQINSAYEELPTKEQVMAVIDMLFDELKEDVTDDDLLESVLYHQDGNLIRRDIKGISSDEEINLMSVFTINNSKKEYYSFVMEDFKLEDLVTKNSKETIHNLTITSVSKDYDFSGEELVVTEQEDITKATVKTKKIKNNHYNTEFLVDGSDVNVSMEYIKNKETSKEYDVDLNFKVSQDNQNVEVNTGLYYKKDIKLNKINTKNNEIVLNEKSKEELVKLWEDNEEQILEKIQGKFGSAFYYEEIMNTTQKRIEEIQQNLNTIERITENLEYTQGIESVFGEDQALLERIKSALGEEVYEDYFLYGFNYGEYTVEELNKDTDLLKGNLYTVRVPNMQKDFKLLITEENCYFFTKYTQIYRTDNENRQTRIPSALVFEEI